MKQIILRKSDKELKLTISHLDSEVRERWEYAMFGPLDKEEFRMPLADCWIEARKEAEALAPDLYRKVLEMASMEGYEYGFSRTLTVWYHPSIGDLMICEGIRSDQVRVNPCNQTDGHGSDANGNPCPCGWNFIVVEDVRWSRLHSLDGVLRVCISSDMCKKAGMAR